MNYLLDTCVISELVGAKPNRRVTAWVDGQDEASIFLSAITIGELTKGIARLPQSKKRAQLQEWLTNDVARRFDGRILAVDVGVATAWGELLGRNERTGVKLPVMDSLIAATAQQYGMLVVTRNVKDMQRCEADVYNPWDGE